MLRVIDDFPAAGAGVAAGEIVRSVDGDPVEGHTVSWVVSRLVGANDTEVVLTTDAGKRRLRRRAGTWPGLLARRVDHGIGVVEIRRMSRSGPRELDARLAAIEAPGPLSGLVIDLRGNRGGSMLAAAAMADRFVARGTLLETADRGGRPVADLRQRVDATPGGRTTLPLMVLVDGRTASSAELLAAALAHHGRAQLVGARTFGKNFVQKLHHFEDDNLTLKLSAAYVHAAGRRLPPDGLLPGVAVAGGAELDTALELLRGTD